MEFYIPSLLLVLLAAVIGAVLVPRLSQQILIVLCLVLLGIGFANHYSLFWAEYKNMNWINTAIIAGPYLMLGTVIVLSIGYILLQFTSIGSKGIGNPSMSIPPPETATNYVTRGIGNSLVSSGLGRVSSGRDSLSLNNSAISQKI
jgi:hypothetical protein